MSFLTTITSALKGGGGPRVPIARGFTSPWAFAFDGGGAQGPRPFDYNRSVREGFCDNPVAQRSVRAWRRGWAARRCYPLTRHSPP